MDAVAEEGSGSWGSYLAQKYIGEALFLVDRMDPEKRMGYELAKRYARMISEAVYQHNRLAASQDGYREIPGDYGTMTPEEFREAGFDKVDVIKEYVKFFYDRRLDSFSSSSNGR